MRFSLQNVNKQVRRRGGELSVGLHFLRSNERVVEIGRLIAYHEGLLQQPKRRFSVDEARALVGDYRLADCLVATLSAWYNWQLRDWTEMVERLQDVDGPAEPALRAAGITSPAQLRLALFDYVNLHHHGFLDEATRVQALRAFAALYHLSLPDLEYLLMLDSDEEALLAREAQEPPAIQEVATLPNPWAFEAALSNASQVHFVIDCNAFRDKQQEPATRREPAGVGVGAVIKRLCYLARRLGVYYDLAYDDQGTTLPTAGQKSRAGPNPFYLHLTLYGPQEMTGLPQQYGLRLAQLCRSLLGYGTRAREDGGRQRNRATLAGTIVKAEASVHFSQRAYRFELDANLLALIGADAPAVATKAEARQADTSAIFDSGIEQSFAEAFGALESSQGVDGWHLEREPEPLLLDQGIFIPDFALSRAQRRIYVEILGFWTPAYRERKIQKLHQLQQRDDLVLAIPQEAREAFAPIAAAFPIVWYENQLSATELLGVLRSRYDDFAERQALIDVTAVRAEVRRASLIAERSCYALLHCYRRSELLRAIECVVGDGIAFAVGVGLYQTDWLEHLRRSFVQWMESVQGLSLPDVLSEIKARWPVLDGCEDATLEALLGLWPEVRVRRTSIFEAQVEYAAASPEDLTGDAADSLVDAQAPVKKPSRGRERRAAQKKPSSVDKAAQGDLWL